jgi:hypothetical protein
MRPYHTCTEQYARNMSALGFIGPRRESEHCGGCGWKHAQVEVTVFEAPIALDDLQGRGHVGGYYDRERGFMAVCKSSCCRDSREVARWIAPDKNVTTGYFDSARTAADDAMEEWYERNYASSYGLGL